MTCPNRVPTNQYASCGGQSSWCWANMLLMFVIGTGSVGWMMAIGVLMAIEKNVSWGRQVTVPLGAGLVLTSATIFALNV